MSNSSLIEYTNLSPNRTSPRNAKIDMIIPHVMAGNLSIETCGEMFAKSSTACCSHYGIGSDGRKALYCNEANRAWCTSNEAIDHRAVTIEIANDGGEPDWHISDKALASTIQLCADICIRNGIPKLLWEADPNLIGDVSRQNIACHRWFKNKACPGDYVYSILGYIADEVNKIIDGAVEIEEVSPSYVISPLAYDDVVWEYLKSTGMTDAGAAGVMGNLFAESGLIPNNLQNTFETKLKMNDMQYTESVDNRTYSKSSFVNDGAGYGLAQWTYHSRKQGLYELAESSGTSIGDLTTQLKFMLSEFNSYSNMMETLKSTTSVRIASDVVLTDYERPADMSDSVKVRRSEYSQSYYDKHAGKNIVENSSADNIPFQNKIEVKYLSTKEVASIQTKRECKEVLDLKSGKSFNISWAAAATYHSDWTPWTSEDVNIIKEILKDSGSNCNWNDTSAWSWTARPGVLKINDDNYVACGFHLRPHAAIMGGNPGAPFTNQSNTRPDSGWALGGHMCMYYGDSPGGTLTCNTAAKEAVQLGNEFFNSNNQVTTNTVENVINVPESVSGTPCNYTVRVTTTALNYRRGPGTNNQVAGTIVDRGIYTIIEESSGTGASLWGKLKSGAGWISLDFTTKI